MTADEARRAGLERLSERNRRAMTLLGMAAGAISDDEEQFARELQREARRALAGRPWWKMI